MRNIPWQYDQEFLDDYKVKSKVIAELGFCLVSMDWIEQFARWIGDRKCVEIMAGSGALSYALQEVGVQIIATDNYSWTMKWDTWTEVEDIECTEAIRKYDNAEIYIMSWPYMNDSAHQALLTMREVNPDALMIYIGEGDGGCTADDTFHGSIEEIEDSAIDRVNDIYPRWPGIWDRLFLVR